MENTEEGRTGAEGHRQMSDTPAGVLGGSDQCTCARSQGLRGDRVRCRGEEGPHLKSASEEKLKDWLWIALSMHISKSIQSINQVSLTLLPAVMFFCPGFPVTGTVSPAPS